MAREPILFVSAPRTGQAFAERWRGVCPTFWCVLGHTDTCLVPGISSAGVTKSCGRIHRRLTPKSSCSGRQRVCRVCRATPSALRAQAGITRAALHLAGLEVRLVGAGLRVWPETPVLRASELPGARIDAAAPAVANAC